MATGTDLLTIAVPHHRARFRQQASPQQHGGQMNTRHSDHPAAHPPGVLTNFWRIILEVVAIGSLYSLAAHTANMAYLLATGQHGPAGENPAGVAGPIPAAFGVVVTLPDPLAELLIACVVSGVITYMVLKWICDQEWVRESVDVTKCWSEVKWYNPWSWVEAVVCTVKEVLQWVLKQICKQVTAIVVVLVLLCILLVVVAVLL